MSETTTKVETETQQQPQHPAAEAPSAVESAAASVPMEGSKLEGLEE